MGLFTGASLKWGRRAGREKFTTRTGPFTKETLLMASIKEWESTSGRTAGCTRVTGLQIKCMAAAR